MGSIVSPPLIAQHDGVFDEIQCSKLRMVNISGKNAVLLDAAYDSNGVVVYDKEGNKRLH